MNTKAFDSICVALEKAGADFRVPHHLPCRTSVESAAARAAGAPNAIGAKAILCKLDFNHGTEFAFFVLPGTHKMDSAAARAAVPGLRKLRFATPEEMLQNCGVLPGCLPPFGNAVFPTVSKLYVDNSLKTKELLGFNAADFARSIVISASDYVRTVSREAVFINFAKSEVVHAPEL